MKFEQEMLKNDIVKINTTNLFTWSSGIKSPIYCDNRMILGKPNFRNYVITQFVEIIKNNYPDVEIIIGTSTAGIAPAALIAQQLNLPFGYVRANAKNHGTKKLVEGVVINQQKVLVIEDLISTGSSVLNVCEILKDASATILGVVAIFSYNLEIAKQNFQKAKTRYQTISDIDMLLKSALEKKAITTQQLKEVENFLRTL